jgi:uncharacterized membrane protein YeaQ/YmgE (transglycosylase-associated protein family)
MELTLSELIPWLVVGALAGWLAGIVTTGRRAGYGRFVNLLIGLVGALIGGFIFKLFNIDLGLGDIAIKLKDLIAAFVGSIIFVLAVWIGRMILRRREKAV